ncbi:MAG: hypothetical protein ABJA82_04510 [Myxococcales bacterium]
MGCGSSSGNGAGGESGKGGKNGTTGATGGTSGSLGGTTGSQGGSTDTTGSGGTPGGGGANGACANIPPCLATLAACAPSGTCVQQKTSNAMTGSISSNTCYSNGVKEAFVTMINIATMSEAILGTFSKSGSTCFTESADIPLAGADSTTITFKNGAGATIATLTSDTATGTDTLTCGGQTYDVTNLGDCGMPMGTTPASNCTDGTCP